MTRRSHFHRIVGALSSALLLQLSLLGSGTLCPMHWSGAHGMAVEGAPLHATTHAGNHAHGMRHSSSQIGSAGTHRAVADPGAPAGACGAGSSCDMPWTPGTCTSMGGCAIGTAAPAMMISASASVPSPLVVAAARAALLPLGPTFAPELPPPRA